MKVTYWQIIERGTGFYVIKFWTKPDKSNALTFKTVIIDEDKIRVRITQMTGKERFTLHHVKTKP